MNERRSIRSNAIFATGGNILRGILGFVVGLLIARALGPAGRGEFTFVTNTALLLVMLAGAGIPSALTRAKAMWGSATPELYAASVVVGVGVGVVAVLLFGATYFFMPGLYRNVGGGGVAWIAAVVIPLLVLSHWTVVAYLDDRVRELVGATVLGAFLLFVIVTILAATGDLHVHITIAAWATTSLVPLAVVFRRAYFRHLTASRPLVVRMLRYGAKANLASLALILAWRVDVLLVKGARGLGELGLYAVAVSIGEIILQVAVSFRIALSPRMGSSEERGELVDSICRTSRVVLVGCGLPAVLLIVLSQPIMAFLYGDAFLGAAPALAILLPGVVVLVLQGPFIDYLLTEGKVRGVTFWTTVALALNVALNLWWLQDHSFVYAALASTVAYFVSASGTAHLFCRVTGRSWRELLIPSSDDVRMILEAARFRRGPRTA